MKQMRSRFRLISLLLVCAFLLAAALCTGTALKAAGISLASLPSLPPLGISSPTPDPSVSPSVSPGGEPTPSPVESDPAGSLPPGTDNTPDPEYNVFGL